MNDTCSDETRTAAGFDVDRCVAAVGTALGRDALDRADIATITTEPAGHRVENMTTESLDLVTVTLVDGASCRLFRKRLHHVSQSPMWQFIPDEHRRQVETDLDWLDELKVYRSSLADDLPDGLRLPTCWFVDAPVSDPKCYDDARLDIWMEAVADHPAWTLDRYARVARRLGAMAGRWPEERVTAELGFPRRPLARLFFGKIVNHDLMLLSDDEFWQQVDVVTADRSLRHDLFELANRVPSMIARIDESPHGLAHGDATPDNLLEPADGSTVAIDWSYGHAGAVGSDLAQLLVGRIERGAHDPEELGDIWATIRPAFLDGLADERCVASGVDVDLAMLTHVSVRSVFSALILERRPDLSGDDYRELMSRRAAMARFCLDLILT